MLPAGPPAGPGPASPGLADVIPLLWTLLGDRSSRSAVRAASKNCRDAADTGRTSICVALAWAPEPEKLKRQLARMAQLSPAASHTLELRERDPPARCENEEDGESEVEEEDSEEEQETSSPARLSEAERQGRWDSALAAAVDVLGSGLTTLRLNGSGLCLSSCLCLSTASAQAIAVGLPKLCSLELEVLRVESGAANMLMAQLPWPRLEVLRLRWLSKPSRPTRPLPSLPLAWPLPGIERHLAAATSLQELALSRYWAWDEVKPMDEKLPVLQLACLTGLRSLRLEAPGQGPSGDLKEKDCAQATPHLLRLTSLGQLTVLTLPLPRSQPQAGVPQLLAGLPALTELDLGCMHLGPAALQAACQHLPQLVALRCGGLLLFDEEEGDASAGWADEPPPQPLPPQPLPVSPRWHLVLRCDPTALMLSRLEGAPASLSAGTHSRKYQTLKLTDATETSGSTLSEFTSQAAIVSACALLGRVGATSVWIEPCSSSHDEHPIVPGPHAAWLSALALLGPGLACLRLCSLELQSDDIQVLTLSTALTGLTSLTLDSCYLEDLSWLYQLSRLERLEKLVLDNFDEQIIEWGGSAVLETLVGLCSGGRLPRLGKLRVWFKGWAGEDSLEEEDLVEALAEAGRTDIDVDVGPPWHNS